MSEQSSKRIPFVRPFLPPPDEILPEVRDILLSGILTKGPRLRRFEEMCCQALEVPFAIGVNSCTTGLMLLLMSVAGEEGEVILPSFTFVATALPVIWNRLTPVFVDCRPDTLNIDPCQVEEAITPRTKAILVTHVFGNPADIDALQRIAAEHGIKLFFDAAHAFGTKWRGSPVGGMGDGAVFSCTPTKLVIAGEGGVVTTRHQEIAELVAVAREYGNPGDYDNILIGLNGRLPEVNALLGIKSIELLPESIARRRAIARRYREELGKLPGIRFQQVHPLGETSYKDFAILIDAEEFGADRDQVAEHLAARGVETKKYFDPPIHLQKAFRQWRPSRKLAATERVAKQILCLPIYPGLTEDEVTFIVQCIAEAGGHA